MPLHIEISGELSLPEWDALATLASLMGGTILGRGGGIPAPTPFLPPVDTVPLAAAVVTPPPLNADLLPPAGPTAQELRPDLPVTSGIIVDKEGLPWDARIHVSTRTMTKEGLWTSKRNLDADLRAGVKAELLKLMALTPPASVPAAPVGDAEIAAAFPPVAGAEAAPAVTPPPPPPPPPPPVTTEAAPTPDTPFQAFMKRMLARQTAKTIDTATLSATAVALGLTGITDLSKRPDLIETFETMLPPVPAA